MNFDVFTFLVALVPLIFIAIPSTIPSIKDDKRKSSIINEFKTGIISMRNVPGLLSLILSATFFNFLVRPFSELFSYFIYDVHDGNALELAFVIAFQPIANIIGGFINTFKKS